MLPCSSTSASIVVCTSLVYHRGTWDGPQNKRCPRPSGRRGHRAAPQLAVRVPP
jgi:hypothetical protein